MEVAKLKVHSKYNIIDISGVMNYKGSCYAYLPIFHANLKILSQNFIFQLDINCFDFGDRFQLSTLKIQFQEEQ